MDYLSLLMTTIVEHSNREAVVNQLTIGYLFNDYGQPGYDVKCAVFSCNL